MVFTTVVGLENTSIFIDFLLYFVFRKSLFTIYWMQWLVIGLLLLSHFSRVNSVWPHRRQPTRLPRHWDSPGKNTGVGYHFLLQCMKVKSENEVTQSCPTLSDPTDYSPPGSSVHGIFQARVLEWGAISFSCDRVRSVLMSNKAEIPVLTEQRWKIRLWILI